MKTKKATGDMVRKSLYLPKELSQDLDVLSTLDNRSVNSEIIHLLKQAILLRKKEK